MPSLLIPLALALFLAEGPNINTVIGTGEPGYAGDGGPAVRALLNTQFDVAYDANGNLYVADTFNHCVRKVAAETGKIETVAGNGTKGFSGDGGPAVRAQLNEPYGLVIDRDGNLYFADRLNRRVRRIDRRSGVISTIAGNGTAKSAGDGGPADQAGLAEPNGVALDHQGRLLIADVAGHRIRAVDLATGRISTFAGTGKAAHNGDGGPAGEAAIFGARAVDVGPDGTVFVLEREGNTLRAIDPKSSIITVRAGTGAKGYAGDGGPAKLASFNGPKELAVDPSGNILIADTENHVIRRIDARTGLISTVAGSGKRGGQGDGGPATSARLDRPHGAAFTRKGGFVIGDTGNHRVRQVGP